MKNTHTQNRDQDKMIGSQKGLVLGMKRFVQFSAVEGMQMTPRVSSILTELYVEGLEGKERQKAILELMDKNI